MSLTPAPRWPLADDVVRAADVRSIEPRTEILRCADVLRALETVAPAELISARQPIVADDLVSVVVPMFNARRWIASCLNGLLAQTHRNLEIFCVDDCSEDDTYARVVAEFGHDGRVCAVRLARNVGPFQISNWVAGYLARGRRIAWQDADNVSHPARIATQWQWMEQHDYRISGACIHHLVPAHLKPYWPNVPPVELDGMRHEIMVYLSTRLDAELNADEDVPAGWERRWQRNELGLADLAQRGLVASAFNYLSLNLCNHGTQMVDTALFRELGGFFGRTKLGEDSEFDWRVSRFHRIGNVPRVLGSRRSHSESLTQTPATALGSPARRSFRSFLNTRREEITRALQDGNTAQARALCTETLHRAEIQIERAHCAFDIELSGLAD
ncbi:MAG: glycosyltransferase family 2 protein [bacterium]